jgi:maleate isomerase
MYGWRGRIGLLVPSSNTTCEMEFHKLIPEGISIHKSRCFLQEDETPGERIASIVKMGGGLLEAAKRVSSVEPDLIVWACTVGSFIKGKGYDVELTENLEREIGVPIITTSTAVLEALKNLGAQNIAMATPYIDEINMTEKNFFEESIPGIKVVNIRGLGIIPNLPKGRLFPETAYLEAKHVNTESSDALFLSCTNWRTLEIIDPLESDINKPVVSSVQATIWLTFRRLGLPNIQGYGRLLEKIQEQSI